MEKTVVRRGIGAVVLALVAALLLGYLLKGKAPDREKVVNMELPKSPIQIFPDGEAEAGDNTVAGADGSGSLDGTDAGAVGAAGANSGDASTQGANALAATGAAAVAGGAAAVMAKTGSAAGNVAGAAKATANAGNAAVADATKNKLVDAKTGNPSLDKSKVVVDGSGQAVFGAKNAGAKNSPAKIDFRTTEKKQVRPSVDGKATLKKRQVATKPRVKSRAKLVGEKKLPPVGRSTASKKSGSSKGRKVASSRGSSNSSKASSSRNKTVAKAERKVVKAKKKVVKAKQNVAKKKSAPVGRNKYVVQLLATSNPSKANSLKATMKREGYAAYVTKGGSLYRVRVGSYTGRAAAIKVQSRMKRRYRKNSYVQSSIVVRN